MWRRRSWFSLKGKAGIPVQAEGCPATSIGPRVLPVGSLQQRDVSTRPRATLLSTISLAPKGASTHVAKFFRLRQVRDPCRICPTRRPECTGAAGRLPHRSGSGPFGSDVSRSGLLVGRLPWELV